MHTLNQNSLDVNSNGSTFPTLSLPTPVTPVMNGRGLRRRVMSAAQRVRLAADLATGEIQVRPSYDQAAALAGVTPAQLRAELKVRTQRKAERKAELEARLHQRKNGTNTAVLSLNEAWNAASPQERAEAFNAIGIASVWDVLASTIE